MLTFLVYTSVGMCLDSRKILWLLGAINQCTYDSRSILLRQGVFECCICSRTEGMVQAVVASPCCLRARSRASCVYPESALALQFQGNIPVPMEMEDFVFPFQSCSSLLHL